jgi:hypothetical protein
MPRPAKQVITAAASLNAPFNAAASSPAINGPKLVIQNDARIRSIAVPGRCRFPESSKNYPTLSATCSVSIAVSCHPPR